tara:strand:+ start:107 stop:499 length:393 start_codon:yes stop_codon:yes gene_type:complete
VTSTEQIIRDRINDDGHQPYDLGGRIRPSIRYSNDNMPAVIYNILSDETQNRLGGSDGQVVEAECVALSNDYGAAREIAERVRELFNAYTDSSNQAACTVGNLDIDQLAPVDGAEVGPWAATVTITIVRT